MKKIRLLALLIGALAATSVAAFPPSEFYNCSFYCSDGTLRVDYAGSYEACCRQQHACGGGEYHTGFSWNGDSENPSAICRPYDE